MTFVQPRTLDLLPHPYFIVTEGLGDARFVDELLQFKGITSCSVGCPSRDSSKGKMGKDAFPDYFASIQVARTKAASVPMQGLLVVADANGDATNSFDAVAAALLYATFPVPSRAFNVEGAPLKTAVYLLPGERETGTLEHLLLKAVFGKTPSLEECIVDYSACTSGLKSAKPNVQAKMRMSVLAATFCEDNPWCSLGLMWSDKNNPVPIDSPHFDHFSSFLATFAV